jgi:hypothetical protein
MKCYNHSDQQVIKNVKQKEHVQGHCGRKWAIRKVQECLEEKEAGADGEKDWTEEVSRKQLSVSSQGM